MDNWRLEVQDILRWDWSRRRAAQSERQPAGIAVPISVSACFPVTTTVVFIDELLPRPFGQITVLVGKSLILACASSFSSFNSHHHYQATIRRISQTSYQATDLIVFSRGYTISKPRLENGRKSQRRASRIVARYTPNRCFYRCKSQPPQ